MPKTALILGASGRFGGHMKAALTRHGWHVRSFNRAKDTLPDAAQGADLIVNAWNMAYAQWAEQIPALTAQVIAATQSSGAAVLIPGNIYVYGDPLPEVLGPDTPHRATNALGKIRHDMEAAYRAAGVKTIILRAGDYLDNAASGNWFDRIIAAKLAKGKLTYPGPLDRTHLWAYLPDLAEAGAHLADKRDDLPHFSDFPFEGFALTGAELATAITEATGQPVRARQMSWLPIHLARPFWGEAKGLLEMRYLWQSPHRADGSALKAAIPGARTTPLHDALRQACAPMLQKEISTQTNR